jgi:hypothetical protein
LFDFLLIVAMYIACQDFAINFNLHKFSYKNIILGPSGPVTGIWAEWSEFEPCSATCGSANQTRARECLNPETSLPSGDCPNFEQNGIQTVPCVLQPCKYFILYLYLVFYLRIFCIAWLLQATS